MADRTLTINHADGGSETYTINRDKFAGVREMSRGHVYPPSIEIPNSTNANYTFTSLSDDSFRVLSNLVNDGVYSWQEIKVLPTNIVRIGKHLVEFDLTLHSGSIANRDYRLMTRDGTSGSSGNQYVITEGSNSIEVVVEDNGISQAEGDYDPYIFFTAHPDSQFDVTISNLKVTHEPDTVAVDHTAVPKHQSKETTLGGSQSITIKRDIEPLLSKVVGGAAAAYSLRDLHDTTGVNKVVRVRRESDNNERDFTAKEVSNGTLQNWTNAQVTPPLDVRELTATGRDGPIIEAAAAYSLRSLSADGTSLTSTGDTQTDYFVFTGATGDTAALNGTQYVYGFPWNGAKGYNSEPPAPENSKMIRNPDGSWLLFDSSIGEGKTYAKSAIGSTEYPWEADWTGSELENATFSQQSTGSLVTQVRRNTDGELRSFTASEVTDGTLEAWVNTSFANALPLDTASGAAAAYSLRSLSSSYTGSVVEVRRGSDGNTESFTAAEVTDGTLLAWVNADIDKLDLQQELGSLVGNVTNETATGFDLSVNNEGSYGYKNITGLPVAGTYVVTFNAVLNSGSLSDTWLASTYPFVMQPLQSGANSVAVTVDGTGNIYFRVSGTAVADVSITNLTLTQTSADGTVSKWYDQSGNDNHATQGTPASQPKIVSGGSLVSGGLDFDGVDDGLFTAGNFTDTLQSATIFALTQDDTTSGIASMVRIRPNGNLGTVDGLVWEKNSNRTYWANTLIEGDNGAVSAALSGQGTRNTSKNLNTLVYQQSRILAHENGALDATLNNVGSGSVPVGDVTLVDQLWLGQNFDDNNRPFNGTMSEVIVYFTDQSDRRRAIEENIGSNYGITLTSSKDGTVSKWYDQSTTSGVPNANHAVQTDAASQPKIVDGGSLVTQGGLAAINFDSSSKHFDMASIGFGNTWSMFGVINATGLNSKILSQSSSSGGAPRIDLEQGSPDKVEIVSNSFAGADKMNLAGNINTRALISLIDSANSFTAFTNGLPSSENPTTINGSFTFSVIGSQAAQVHQELILYNSDQTDNRTALEANIGEVYGIAGIPAYDDTVNGFVETWYDQSGNGKNATQLTAGNQPKIVDAGVYLGEVDFLNGTNTYLQTTNSDLCNVSELSVFSVLKPHIASSQVVAFSCGSVINNSTAYGGWRLNFNGYLNQAQFQTQTIGNASVTSLNKSVGGNDTLVSCVANFPDAATFANGQAGSSTSSAISPSNNNTFRRRFRIGCQHTYQVAGFYSKPIKEIILYTSDQSANRPAIEANINNQYDIY